MIAASLINAVGEILGRRPVGSEIISGRGYTAALRFRVLFEDGSSVFVKTATNPDTARWLTVEIEAYEALAGQHFLPDCYGSGSQPDNPNYPFLILEDLSGAHWPPPWTSTQIDAILNALSDIHRHQGSLLINCRALDVQEAETPTWKKVAATPEPFLSLGFCSRNWLENALPILLSATDAAPLAGDCLLHLDVRSDNMCIRPNGTAALVDWNWVCRGNPDFDIATWLPSLHQEGGPLPETILPNAPELAAWLAGFWAQNAGLPPLPDAPRVRDIQKRQLRSALPWAVRALRLPPLDGTV